MPARLNLVGVRFGRLFVENHYHGIGRRNCEVLCDCGIKMVASEELRNGATKSCGCLRDELHAARVASMKKSLVGQTFGKLFVFSQIYRDKHTLCLVRCDCGTIKLVGAFDMKNGNPRSCGAW